jgi:hypothetical protein
LAKVSNKPRENGHRTSTYLPLQENLRGEVEKGVLTKRGASAVGHASMGGDAGERSKEWLRWPKKWSATSSLAA